MAWTNSGNIRGPVGATGATGAQGPTGPTGPTGPAGTTTWSGITDKPAVIAAGSDAAGARNAISAEYTGNKGQANGYASLDSSGLVPSSQLPSFVDDVIEGATTASFPATGSAGVIYTALDTNKIYRWGGSSYVEISPSPGSTDAVPEGSTNLYYTNARADGRITAAIGSTIQAYSATLTNYAAKTAPSGDVVGTTDSQTLTGKTLNFASGNNNTIQNVPTSALPFSGAASAYVSAYQSITSPQLTWLDLATTTDQVTVTIGASGMALALLSANMLTTVAGQQTYMGLAVSGANTYAAAPAWTIVRASTTVSLQAGTSALFTGLNAGSTTFKLKYMNSGGGATATFGDRSLAVIPL